MTMSKRFAAIPKIRSRNPVWVGHTYAAKTTSLRDSVLKRRHMKLPFKLQSTFDTACTWDWDKAIPDWSDGVMRATNSTPR